LFIAGYKNKSIFKVPINVILYIFIVMKAVSITTLRRSIKEYFDYVSKSMEVIVVSRN